MSKATGQVDNQLKEILADVSQPGTGTTTPWTKRKIATCSALLCLALVALFWACFARTLTTYFLADDFGEIAYASKICAGRWDMFAANWTGNYMQIPGMAVYRPLLLVTLISDFLLWKGNAIGYYLTNLLFVTGDTLLLYFVCRQLTNKWNVVRSLTASFFAAALFAVNPLHCESISWVVGRVDSGCCFFYLTSLLLFLHGRQNQRKSFIAASVLSFWSALFFKEMAIGLPILVTAIAFIFPLRNVAAEFSFASLRTRAISMIVESAPFWISTVLYFGLRYLTLGTLLGGYSGAIGDGQADSAIQRWLDVSTYYRVLFPFCASIFAPGHIYPKILLVAFSGLVCLILFRALRKELPLSYVAFVGAWLLTAALPIYKLWGIGLNLEGARFCFFLTLPLSAALPLLAMAQSSRRDHAITNTDKASLILPALILTCVVGVLYKTSLSTNAVWVHAGKEVKSAMTSAISTVDAQPGTGKLITLGIPKRNASAHMIYNGATFKTMLEPPFTSKVYSERFLTFDPIFFGPDQFINSARLKQTLDDPTVQAACVWHGPGSGFYLTPLKQLNTERHRGTTAVDLPVQLSVSSAQPYTDGHATTTPLTNGASFHGVVEGDGLRFDKLNVNPLDYDFIEFSCRLPGNTDPLVLFKAKWKGSDQGPNKDKNDNELFASRTVAASQFSNWHTARIPLSHYWRWFVCKKITELSIVLPAGKDVEIANVRLVSDRQLRPSVLMTGRKDDGMGVFICPTAAPVSLDVSNIPSAASILVECSRPNYFFDQFEEDKQASAVFKTIILKSNKTNFDITKNFCPPNQYCEVRARAIDAHGAPLAEYSEPVIVYVNQ